MTARSASELGHGNRPVLAAARRRRSLGSAWTGRCSRRLRQRSGVRNSRDSNSALEVRVREGRFVIEQAPAWRRRRARSGCRQPGRRSRGLPSCWASSSSCGKGHPSHSAQRTISVHAHVRRSHDSEPPDGPSRSSRNSRSRITRPPTTTLSRHAFTGVSGRRADHPHRRLRRRRRSLPGLRRLGNPAAG